MRKGFQRSLKRNFGRQGRLRKVPLPARILNRRVRVGTLDDPGLFGTPQMAIYTVDKQPFHHVPDGLPAFERMPPR